MASAEVPNQHSFSQVASLARRISDYLVLNS